MLATLRWHPVLDSLPRIGGSRDRDPRDGHIRVVPLVVVAKLDICPCTHYEISETAGLFQPLRRYESSSRRFSEQS